MGSCGRCGASVGVGALEFDGQGVMACKACRDRDTLLDGQRRAAGSAGPEHIIVPPERETARCPRCKADGARLLHTTKHIVRINFVLPVQAGHTFEYVCDGCGVPFSRWDERRIAITATAITVLVLLTALFFVFVAPHS